MATNSLRVDRSIACTFFVLLCVLNSIASVAAADPGLIWTASGGGWRSMAANTAYANVLARIGLFDTSEAPAKESFDVIATTSGSSWFTAQFGFSAQYYSETVDGTPESLGDLTQKWFEAYASTQSDVTNDCGPLQDLCNQAGQLPPGSDVASLLALLPLMNFFNFSWPNLVYSMFQSCSESYGDDTFVNVKASSESKLSQLRNTNLHFHTSLVPNMRARSTNTITYLGQQVTNPQDASSSSNPSSYTVPLPRDWVVRSDEADGWYAGIDPHAIPGGVVHPSPPNFVGSDAAANFPMFPLAPTDGVFTTPAGNETGSINPEDMAAPFGGTPTAVQVSTASSSTLGYISEALPSYFAQFFSLQSFGIQQSGMDEASISALLDTINGVQELFWQTGIMANIATCSAWKNPDPKDMPSCSDNEVYFTDGGYTDGPAAGLAISEYQKSKGIENEIKVIISNQNLATENMNNILMYFNTSWNAKVMPGELIWAPGVGSGFVTNPWQSPQIFDEYLDEESITAAFEPIEGTNLTMAILNATTIENPAFGVVAGQKVSIAILNLNSDIPTFLVTEQVITSNIPKLVDLVEEIAGSEELEARLRLFVGTDDKNDGDTSSAYGSTHGLFSNCALALIGCLYYVASNWF